MPYRRASQALTHDRRQNHELSLNRRQHRVVGQEEAINDRLLQPLKVRPMRAPRSEYRLQVLSVKLLQERRPALLRNFVNTGCRPIPSVNTRPSKCPVIYIWREGMRAKKRAS